MMGSWGRFLGLTAEGLLSTCLVVGIASAQVMSVPGKLDIGPTGAANYTVPIAVPPGTAGMHPSLELEYSSQQGNGMLGVGWALGGLPSIGRCAQTLATDGVRGGINYDGNDRFCLDGQRLMAITGTYGADGTEYRTELESFSKIVSHGTAGTGPAWFQVFTKSGQMMEFGNTSDSQVLAQGKTTARAWSVNKVSDTKGNYFTVTYTADAPNGQAYPSRIDYTGNTAAGLMPYNSVQFSYATRPDAPPLYQAGSLLKTVQRLTDVKTYAGASLVADYQLTYQQSASSGQSRITSVKLCAADGSCLPATSLAWSNGGNGAFSPSSHTANPGWNFGNPPSNGYTSVVGDFNGDGKTDYMLLNDLNQFMFLSNGDGTFAPSSHAANGWNFGNPPTNNYILVVGDFNGDGKTDYLLLDSVNQFVFLSNGDGGFTPSSHTANPGWNFGSPPSQSYTLATGDFNGDGKTDYMLLDGANQFVFLSNGDGTFTPSSHTANPGWNFGTPPTTSYILVLGDFNGDGKTDYMLLDNVNQFVFLSNGDGTFAPHSQIANAGWNFGSPPSQSYTLATGDFNGDGKTDYMLLDGANQFVFLSNGDGTFTPSSQTANPGWNFGTPPTTSYILVLGDFNGDGKTDYMLLDDVNQFVFLSNGDGTFAPHSQIANAGWNFGNPPYQSYTPVTGDFNGDGEGEYMLLDAVNQFVFQSNGSAPDLLSSITTGLGSTTAVTYQPLRGSVYTKDNTATYPTVDFQGAMYVVSRVDAPNGIGGTYGTSYSYAGARLDLSGRGFLGFRQMVATDLQTNVVQTTSYRQDYPYIGLVASSTKTLSGLTLNQTTTTYAATNLGGTRNFVFASQAVESSADLDGTALPTVTTTYQYDAYGNATQVVVSTPDGYSKTTANTYTNDTVNWFLGRLTQATVTSTTP